MRIPYSRTMCDVFTITLCDMQWYGSVQCSVWRGVVCCQIQEGDLGLRVESMSTYDQLKYGREVPKEERRTPSPSL